MLQLLAWAAKASRQRFKDLELERLYSAVRLQRWVKNDQQASLLCAVLWVLTTIKYNSIVHSTRMCYSNFLALLFLTPGAWSMVAPASYAANRQHILLAVRLLPLLFPSLLEAAKHMPLGSAPRHSWNFLAMLVLATRIPAMWVMSLGFRLNLPTHLLVHGIKLLRVLLDNPPLCRSSYFQSSVSQRWFHATAMQFDSAFGAFPSNTTTLLQSPMTHSSWISCLTVLALIELAAGFLFPTLILCISDRASRANFLEALQARQVHLPLDADELDWYLAFDGTASWVMLCAVAPLVLAVLWHVILLATLYLPWLRLPGDAQECSTEGGAMSLGTADVAMAF